MMAGLVLSAAAKSDIGDIWLHEAESGEADADQLLDKILKKCRTLEQYPEIGRGREDLGQEIRSFPVGHYILIYQPASSRVEIIRIVRGTLDPVSRT